MKTAFAFALGLRMLRGKAGTARYLRGAVLGIALGLVPLIVVMEVSTGMIEGITERLIEIRSYHLQVMLPPSSSPRDMEETLKEIRQNLDVRDAVPERQGTGLVFSNGKSAGVTLRFVPPDFFRSDTGLMNFVTITAGTGNLDSPGGILIGAALAKKIDVKVGQRVILLTPYSESGQGPPRVTPLTVRGLFETGYQELEKLFVYASLSASWTILSPRASSAMIGVKVKDPFGDLSAVIRDIRDRSALGSRIYTWRELEYPQLASFNIMRVLLIFIMALITLVAGVNVSSSVIMIAFERRFEIGILKSIGAAPGGIALSFLLAGFATGALGTAGGVLIGLLAAVNVNEIIAFLQLCLNAVVGAFSLIRSSLIPSAPAAEPITIFNSAYYLVRIPIRIHWLEVVLAAAGTLMLSGIASYLPARRAASAAPLEIIRKV